MRWFDFFVNYNVVIFLILQVSFFKVVFRCGNRYCV
nr:MAG TPA: hypothetical protein [Caudoviricetes sp.]